MRPIRCHLGLGDLCIQAGLFVELHLREGPLAIPCYEHYLGSARSFFVNYPGIEVYTIPHQQGWDWGSPPDYAFDQRQRECGYNKSKEIRLGVYKGEGIFEDFAQCFYHQAGIDYNARWDSDPIPAVIRRIEQAQWPSGEKRTFLHDDASRNYRIVKNNPGGFRPQEFDSNTSILRYASMISTARRICVIDSAFFHLVESLHASLDPECQLELHQYARWPRRREFRYRSRLNWNYIR